ncbi:MAG: response regulator [Symploca sp. SIO2E9]|nr:response regulator [Symploca sp. SIO2E9]
MSDQPTILIIAYNQRNLELLGQFLGKAGYQILQASSAEGFEQILTTMPNLQFALIDISGFDQRIWDSCKRLQTTGIPFLVISPHSNAVIERQSLVSGARSVLVKPLAIAELLGLIRSVLGQQP